MTFENLLYMCLIPLLLAGGVLWVVWRFPHRINWGALVVSGSILVLYLLSEGIPPFPPISAKQKIPYLLAFAPITALFTNGLPTKTRVLILMAILLVGIAWLLQRPLIAGNFNAKWIAPFLVIPTVLFAIWQQGQGSPSRFAWPVSILAMMIVTSLVALLGGFLGIGQFMLSVSVFWGGVVLGLFLDVLRQPEPRLPIIHEHLLGALSGSFAILLILIGLYATNLSVPAYLLILTLLCVPLSAQRIGKFAVPLQPFLFAALAATLAVPAIILAVLNF